MELAEQRNGRAAKASRFKLPTCVIQGSGKNRRNSIKLPPKTLKP
jgi:hypothetical protein